MKTIEVVMNLSDSPEEVCILGKQVVSEMTGNPNFPSPFLPLASVQTDVNNLDSAVIKARTGSPADKADARIKAKSLQRSLKVLAAYVEYVSNGNEQVARSSGFPLKKDRPLTAKSFAATQGTQSGVAELVTKSVKYAAYVWQYTKDPVGSAPWTDAGTSLQSSFSVSGLTPLTSYWFRVAVISADGQQAWSNPCHLSVV